MAVSHPLPDDLVELIAERFRALSEPTRIKLLDRLREGEATVLELTELIGTTQQNVSKHLGVLQREGIVTRRKQGNFAYYRIIDKGVFSLCEAVCGSLQQQVESLHQLVGETPTPVARAVRDRVVPGLTPRPRNASPSSLSAFSRNGNAGSPGCDPPGGRGQRETQEIDTPKGAMRIIPTSGP